MAIHQYGDWNKLDQFGWERGSVPLNFKLLSDDEIWWPRNTQKDMIRLSVNAGWKVITPDLNLIKRDSIILLTKE